MFPRGRFLFLFLMMIAPLVGAGIRWPSRMGAGLDTLAATLAWQGLALAWFGLCIAVGFDLKFSPSQLGYGVPLLTFSFCASLFRWDILRGIICCFGPDGRILGMLMESHHCLPACRVWQAFRSSHWHSWSRRL